MLFVTGRTDAADLAEGLRLGAHDYQRKPFDAIELQARVRAAARTGQLRATLRRRNAELERLASSDSLTGLYDRRHLEAEAARAISRLRRHSGTMGVTLLDLDHFKAINDTHGHAAGDAVLQAVAGRLASALRHEDLLGRWGGEEFVVLAADTDATGMALVAERLREAVGAAPVVVDDGPTPAVTVSAGWACARGGVDLDTLVRAADAALYAAKAGGRDTVRGAEVQPGSGSLAP